MPVCLSHCAGPDMVPLVGSQQPCPSLCALATELFLQVQKPLLHCSTAQLYNQALFLLEGSEVKGAPHAPVAIKSHP